MFSEVYNRLRSVGVTHTHVYIMRFFPASHCAEISHANTSQGDKEVGSLERVEWGSGI